MEKICAIRPTLGGQEAKQMVNVYHDQLDRLRAILVTEGTAKERWIIEAVIDGIWLTQDEKQRLKILGRQFLNEDIEV